MTLQQAGRAVSASGGAGLKLKVDGEQSTADCWAIQAFQRGERIKPATGLAGPVTWAR